MKLDDAIKLAYAANTTAVNTNYSPTYSIEDIRAAVKIARLKLAYEHTPHIRSLQDHLKPGDILLTTPIDEDKKKLTTKVHKMGLKLRGLPEYTHVAVYLGNNRIGHVERGITEGGRDTADSEKMTYREEHINAIKKRGLGLAAFRPNVGAQQRQEAIDKLKRNVGVQYSNARAATAFFLPKFLQRLTPVDRKAKICSDIVADAYPTLFESSKDRPMLPAEFGASPHVKLVATYDPTNKHLPTNNPLTSGLNDNARPT